MFYREAILARIEHDKALPRVLTSVLKDDTQLFKQFRDNPSFKKWLTDTVFSLTYSATLSVSNPTAPVNRPGNSGDSFS